ncbi:MAG: MBL fold metallo-hydrolase [Halobacteriota archaeon]
MEFERIALRNHEFEGDNNAYLLDGETTALVDTGVATPDVRRQLREGLRRNGLEYSDVDAVLLTHWHADHSGLAGMVQRESDADVYVHEGDADVVAHDEDEWRRMEETRDDLLGQWGMPDSPREELIAFMEATHHVQGEAVDVTVIRDGDLVPAGDGSLEALHSPGHTSGLTVYHDGDVCFSGDALLPRYTPNVGGADVRTERPLDAYLGSLSRIRERDFEVAHPGHRDPIDEPSGRAVEIARHHLERSRRVVDVLDDDGGLTPWEVGARLFGDLEGIHILHGPGESYAHLDHMERNGVVESEGRRPRRYSLSVEADVARDMLTDSVFGGFD